MDFVSYTQKNVILFRLCYQNVAEEEVNKMQEIMSINPQCHLKLGTMLKKSDIFI